MANKNTLQDSVSKLNAEQRSVGLQRLGDARVIEKGPRDSNKRILTLWWWLWYNNIAITTKAISIIAIDTTDEPS